MKCKLSSSFFACESAPARRPLVAPAMEAPPTARPLQPPWAFGRPRRTGAQRRAQALRAEGRTFQRLLKVFAELQGHRGGQPSQLGTALAAALRHFEPPQPRAEGLSETTTLDTAVQTAAREADTPKDLHPAEEPPCSSTEERDSFAEDCYMEVAATTPLDHFEAPAMVGCDAESLTLQRDGGAPAAYNDDNASLDGLRDEAAAAASVNLTTTVGADL